MTGDKSQKFLGNLRAIVAVLFITTVCPAVVANEESRQGVWIAGREVHEGEDVTLVGVLSEFVLPHPQPPPRDIEDIERPSTIVYVDVLDASGQTSPEHQIQAVFRDLEPPKDTQRPIELTGTAEVIDLGGEPGTTRGYRGLALHVTSWRFADESHDARFEVPGSEGTR